MSEKTIETWRKPRPIIKRIHIKGKLELVTPAHFGGGDPDPLSHVDMALVKDPLEGKALLPGASIAGALRNYLREFQLGYDEQFKKLTLDKKLAKERATWATQLFGGYKGDDAGAQSLLIVDDALAHIAAVELRDGVRIDPATRTARDNMLFSMETLPKGTTFDLSFELVVPKDQAEELVEYTALALHGLEEEGQITLGARKRRGFGRCKVSGWEVYTYDLGQPQGLLDWLKQEIKPITSESIAQALDVDLKKYKDARSYFDLEAKFALDGSLLIRSGFGSREGSPDTAHLHIRDINGNPVPIIPGTSWAGVLRHRALKIAKTVAGPEHLTPAETLVNAMFGAGNEDDRDADLIPSRVVVQDSVISGGTPRVQTRVKLDRFTGGAYETGLINEEPLWSNKTAEMALKLRLRSPESYEIGLLLLVLKDLWTGDLPLGGESSVGRGRLAGKKANLTFSELADPYVIKQGEDGLSMNVAEAGEALQEKVKALQNWFTQEVSK